MIKPADPDAPADIGIIGVPYDGGVMLGGGRPGARLAPEAVRKALKKYGTAFNIEHNIDISDLDIRDFGDVAVTEDIDETHQRITHSVFGLLKKGIFPIVIGGGHDISIGTCRALSNFHSGSIGCINFDAHFDVREIRDSKITSGTPFRRLMDLGLLNGKYFAEVGAHDNLNSKIYYEYLLSKKVSIITLSNVNRDGIGGIMESALRIVGADKRAVFVSIDIDSVAQCFAPGSSAPDAVGFTAAQIREAAYLAGLSDAVKLLDIVEINPEYDVDSRTARLGASVIISFINGYKRRRSAR